MGAIEKKKSISKGHEKLQPPRRYDIRMGLSSNFVTGCHAAVLANVFNMNVCQIDSHISNAVQNGSSILRADVPGDIADTMVMNAQDAVMSHAAHNPFIVNMSFEAEPKG